MNRHEEGGGYRKHEDKRVQKNGWRGQKNTNANSDEQRACEGAGNVEGSNRKGT